MLPALARVLGGVVQQVADHLRQPHRVAAHGEVRHRRARLRAAGCFCSSSGCTVSTAAAMTSATFTGSLTSTILPRAMRDTSSRSSTRRIMCLSCRSMTPRDQMIFGSCVSPCMSMCEALRSGDNGLRSSCDSIARNSSRLTTASLSDVLGADALADFGFERLVGARQLVVGAAAGAPLISSSSRVFSDCSAKLASSSCLFDSASSLVDAPAARGAWRSSSMSTATLLRRISGHHRDVHVVDGAGLVALEPVELGDVHAGHEDDRDGFEARVIVNQRRGLEAVHARHLHVEQHHREFLLHERFERFEAGIHRHEVVAQRLEDGAVRQQPRRLVVHQQDVGGIVAVRNGRRVVHGCNHMRTSDSSCSVFTGLAT